MGKKLGYLLLEWYEKNKRDLPWRQTKDPYLIWVSEIILQQTRIDQGLSYYLRFVKRFPNVGLLANASENEVLNYWQGLGYYSRARNMLASAKLIMNNENGIFPSTYDQILKLKGVGPYTAAAIASIAYNLPHPVIDGNVNRVISRLFGIKSPVNTSLGTKKVFTDLNRIFIEDEPGDFNQSIMELGALVCKPTNPNCIGCVLKNNCIAFRQKKVNTYPVKIKLKAPKNVIIYFFVLKHRVDLSYRVFLNKRNTDSIWKNLYDFPCIEATSDRNIKEVVTEFEQKISIENGSLKQSKMIGPISHKLTHRNIMAYFLEFSIDEDYLSLDEQKLISVELGKLIEYPVPKLIENYIKSHLFT